MHWGCRLFWAEVAPALFLSSPSRCLDAWDTNPIAGVKDPLQFPLETEHFLHLDVASKEQAHYPLWPQLLSWSSYTLPYGRWWVHLHSFEGLQFSKCYFRLRFYKRCLKSKHLQNFKHFHDKVDTESYKLSLVTREKMLHLAVLIG